MMFAEIPSWQSTVSVAALIGTLLSLVFSGLVVYYMKRQSDAMTEANNRPAPSITPQPLKVEVSEELHKEFASRSEFKEHLEKYERQRAELWNVLRAENQRLDNNVTLARTSIAALAKETEIQNAQLARMDSKIDRLIERK